MTTLRQRINRRVNTPAPQIEQDASRLIHQLPSMDFNSPEFQQIYQTANRQPAGKAYVQTVGTESYAIAMAHDVHCATQFPGDQPCNCVVKAGAAHLGNPIQMPHLHSRQGLGGTTKLPNLK